MTYNQYIKDAVIADIRQARTNVSKFIKSECYHPNATAAVEELRATLEKAHTLASSILPRTPKESE